MARIKEFRGFRPRRELVRSIAELPYDAVSSKDARLIAGQNKYSFYHITLPQVDLPEELDAYDDVVYNKGKENLERFIEEGTLYRMRQKNSIFIH